MPSDSPELHSVHKPHGLNLTEKILSIAALVTSAASVFIALRHGDVMDKMLKANSLPFLTFFSGDYVDGKTIAHVTLRNEGVGPARVKSLRLSLDGKPLHNVSEFLDQCCKGHELNGTMEVSHGYERFIPARAESELFAFQPQNNRDATFIAFDMARARLQMELCYCSVFDDCYEYIKVVADAKRVASCPVDPQAEFVP